jgi:homoserine kinase type II
LAVYTHVSAEALEEFLLRYDVGELVSAKGIAEGVENSNYMVDTTKGRFILTLYEKRVEAGDLPYFMALLDHLAERGNPVPPAIKDRQGEALQTLEGRPACLIRFLPGVSVSHPTAAQAEAAGAAMGVRTWQPLFDRCGRSLDDMAPNLHAEAGAMVDRVVRGWQGDGFPQGTIHADLFPDNVLMRGSEVTGLIDFYFACTDALAYDVAVCLNAWCFEADHSYNVTKGQSLLAAYAAVRPLSVQERAVLPMLARGAALRFLLTRLTDWFDVPPGALVRPKHPIEYFRKLRFHQQVKSVRDYGIDA